MRTRCLPCFALLLLGLLLPGVVSAVPGGSGTKLDARLRLLLQQRHASGAPVVVGSGEPVAVFIRGDGPRIAREVRGLGGQVDMVLDRVVTARLAPALLGVLVLSPAVEHIESPVALHLHNDTSAVHISADRVHRGELPLTRPYTGRGVVVGIIDSGIDFTHPEFRDPQDSTQSRILAIWSHVETDGPAPDGFFYGVEYTRADINDELDGTPVGYVRQNDNQLGHGTHVAATAAGNSGMAPGASIIAVQLDFQSGTLDLSTALADAAAYIYGKAEELGMPCVINASLGQRTGIPHNGEDAASLALDALVNARPGRVFCASAGNDGDNKFHWGGFPLEEDSLWIYSFRDNDLYFHMEQQYAASVEIAVEVDSIGNNGGKPALRTIGSTPWMSVAALREAGPLTTVLLDAATGVPNDTGAVITMTAADLPSGHTELLIGMERVQQKFNVYRIKVRGAGTFHSWGAAYVDDPANTNGGLPFNARYKPTDSLMQIGMPAVARRVIAVGSYVNRHTYTDINGIVQPESEFFRKIPGALSAFSSIGPASDGRMKPDISAPGEVVASARVAARFEQPARLVGDGRWMVRNGTSMSTPAVTGAVALYLERHPSASFQEVYNAIVLTARDDEFTAASGPLPNAAWGYGKLDIFEAMTRVIASVPVAAAERAVVYPNPASSQVWVQYNTDAEGAAEVELFDALGRRVMSVAGDNTGQSRQTMRIDTGHLSPGVYLYRLRTGSLLQSGVLTIVP